MPNGKVENFLLLVFRHILIIIATLIVMELGIENVFATSIRVSWRIGCKLGIDWLIIDVDWICGNRKGLCGCLLDNGAVLFVPL